MFGRKRLWVVFVCFCLSALSSPALAQQQPSTTAAASAAVEAGGTELPPNEGAATVAKGEEQAKGPVDICGNPVGTVYGEGAPCTKFEAPKGPYITYKTPWENHLSILAVVLGAVMVLLPTIVFAAAFWTGKSVEIESFYKYFILSGVIGGAIFVLIAGYSDQQVAPLFALFGTVLGYIFGAAKTGPAPAPQGAGGEAQGAGGEAQDKEPKT